MEPQKRIAKDALKVWRISGIIESLLILVIGIAGITLTYLFDFPRWIIILCVCVIIVFVFLFVFLLPTLRWKRWRYEVREDEIEIQSGIWIIKRTLIPMVRVQHVETKQGPLLRRYELATVEISTAATSHEIPALEIKEADDLRFYISRMASVEEEDV